MTNSNENEKIRAKIYEYIEKKNIENLENLDKLGIRQTVRYNIRKLLSEGEIRAFIEFSGKVDSTGIKSKEIYFSITPSNYPHEIGSIKKMIDEMCIGERSTAATAYRDFVNICIEKGVPREDAIKLAYALICGLYTHLRETVVFGLTYPNKIKNPMAGQVNGFFTEPDTISPPSYYKNGEWFPPSKNYDYFIKLLNTPNFISSLPEP